ncbi:hypothetical protein BWI93_10515 [Siphonobacter sp. BAB-5385]|nr:hypothetical protein BWI93_10515 [Siphonobacter sp. BAB-5385]
MVLVNTKNPVIFSADEWSLLALGVSKGFYSMNECCKNFRLFSSYLIFMALLRKLERVIFFSY